MGIGCLCPVPACCPTGDLEWMALLAGMLVGLQRPVEGSELVLTPGEEGNPELSPRGGEP